MFITCVYNTINRAHFSNSLPNPLILDWDKCALLQSNLEEWLFNDFLLRLFIIAVSSYFIYDLSKSSITPYMTVFELIESANTMIGRNI